MVNDDQVKKGDGEQKMQFQNIVKDMMEMFAPLSNNNCGFIPIGQFRGQNLPVMLPVYWPQIRNFPLTEDDVLITSIPKSGMSIFWLF